MRYFLVLACSVGSLACGGYGAPTYFPASSAPYGKPMLLSLPPCAQSIQIFVTDHRANPTVIGQRYEEGTPSVLYPIQLQGDTAAYVRNALGTRLQQSGANAPNTSRETLVVELLQLMIDEKIFYNSEYNAQTNFQAAIWRPDNTVQPCWQRQIIATASNYGKSASIVNYQETLDRLMDAAISELVKAPGFAEALCGQCGAAPASH
jgi:hypothetical protein